MEFELKQQFQIESARFLPNLPPAHPCSRMHGHSFKVTVVLRGPLDPAVGWVIDYDEINRLFKPILNKIDHHILNEVPGLENPTTELLCYWIFTEGKKVLFSLRQVIIQETSSSECRYPAIY